MAIDPGQIPQNCQDHPRDPMRERIADLERQLAEAPNAREKVNLVRESILLKRRLSEAKKDREKLMTIICNAMSAIACADHERSMVMLPEFLEGDLRKFIGDVKAQVVRLRQALEFYADKDNYFEGSPYYTKTTEKAGPMRMIDCGDTAREALAVDGGKEGGHDTI